MHHDEGSSYWQALGRLWDRATGGRDVAANPAGASSFWPTAPAAPGVDEAAQWLEAGLDDPAGHRMMFLVGGPGAGKSHAAARIVGNRRELSRLDDGLAHRTYRFATEGRELLLINDATIGSDTHDSGALVGDFAESMRQGWNVLACVNRGIIVEELAASRENSVVPMSILRWLHDGSTGEGLVSTGAGYSAYLRRARVDRAGHAPLDLVCVLMDSCSLLEVRPSVYWAPGEEPVAERYAVRRFDHRGGLLEASVPGRALFAEVIHRIPDPPEGESLLDPLAANLQSLRSADVRASVVSVLRAGEIVSSKRLTYRELWGAIARSIVGGLTHQIGADAVHDHILGMQPLGPDRVSRFDQVRDLADLRFSQALFGAGEDGATASPVARVMLPVDPARDATPGHLGRSGSTGWATPVVDAFAGGGRDDSPLQSLLRDIGSADKFHAVLTDFDVAVDEAFMAALMTPKLKDARRAEMYSWYGAYLMRLYAVSNGIPAFNDEVGQWTLAWHMSPDLSDQLKRQVTTLLLPRRNPDSANSSFLLPLYESRTTPILGNPSEPRLAIRGGSAEVESEVEGDSIYLVLKEAGNRVARIECDFPLIREILSCAEGHLGVTEFTHTASPRLERLRASQLVPARLSSASLCMVVGDTEEAVTVGVKP